MLEEAHRSTSQQQVVEDESPAGEATKVFFSWVRMDVQKLTSVLENYKNTWMQESAFFNWREKPLKTQLTKNGLTPAQMSQVVPTYAKKQDQVLEVDFDHPVCKIPQGSKKIEARNPLH